MKKGLILFTDWVQGSRDILLVGIEGTMETDFKERGERKSGIGATVESDTIDGRIQRISSFHILYYRLYFLFLPFYWPDLVLSYKQFRFLSLLLTI